MTAVIADTETIAAAEERPVIRRPSWWMRAAALAIDTVPGSAVAATAALAASAMTLGGLWWWTCVAVGGSAILLTATNRVLLPAATGWSLGRAAFGIAVVRRDGAPAGPVRLLLRELAHLVDTASLLVGWLWPVWDDRRRTFADLLTRTEARQVQPPRRRRRVRSLVAMTFLISALLCIAGASTSYLVVYRQDRAIEAARSEILGQGPKIVEQILSYQPATLQEDFARARDLVTDNYRERLVAEQQVVEKAKPLSNQYWAIDRAVLATAPRRAEMLVFLQGQRGDLGTERLITATVRVNFVKSGDALWRVDDLVVLTKPQPTGDGN